MTSESLADYFSEQGFFGENGTNHRRMKVRERITKSMNKYKIDGVASATGQQEGCARISLFCSGIELDVKHIQGITLREFESEVNRLEDIVRRNLRDMPASAVTQEIE